MIAEDQIPKAGYIPRPFTGTTSEPLKLLKREKNMRIGPGSVEQTLISEKEKLKLKKPKRDEE